MKSTITIFKIGDRVEHKNDSTYWGIVTKVKEVPRRGLTHGGYQWLWLDGSEIPCGFTSEQFRLVTRDGIKYEYCEWCEAEKKNPSGLCGNCGRFPSTNKTARL